MLGLYSTIAILWTMANIILSEIYIHILNQRPSVDADLLYDIMSYCRHYLTPKTNKYQRLRTHQSLAGYAEIHRIVFPFFTPITRFSLVCSLARCGDVTQSPISARRMIGVCTWGFREPDGHWPRPLLFTVYITCSGDPPPNKRLRNRGNHPPNRAASITSDNISC